MNGILLVDKAADMTSHDVVAYIRKHFQIKKVGHAGTLDPFATGLLILCLGQATKIAQYLVDCDKEYLAVLKLGETTDTQDCTGQVLEGRDIPALKKEDISKTFEQFVGEISQIPPMFSAKKVQGKRLYELARAGKTVERKARNVTIHELEFLEMSLPYLRFRVLCSKGTYIRTLAHDIGEVLGCGAHLTELRRTRIGQFALSEAYSLEQLTLIAKQQDKEHYLLPMDEALSFLPAVTIPEPALIRLVKGTKISLSPSEIETLSIESHQNQIIRVYSASETFVALVHATTVADHNGEIRWLFQPVKVFVK